MADTHTNDGSTSGLLLTLNRGIQVLEQIAREQDRATAKSLAADLDINLGTCYQVLRTLQANGYVHRLPGSRYGLGSRVGFLIDHYETMTAPPPQLVDILHHLHQQLEETVYISVRRGQKIGIAGVLEGTKILRVGNLTVGYGEHPHIRASTKAFLAMTPDSEVSGFFDSTDDLAALTPNTITTWDDFLVELEATRQRGYGIDNEEYSEGVICIGAVILDRNNLPFGAYGTSFPAARFATDEQVIAKQVLAAGEAGSREMGYTGEYPPPGPI